MSKQYDSEGFMSSPLEGAGARPKDSYHPDSEDNEVRFRAADEEYQRLKADFARIARDRRLNSHSRSDSSRSSSPLGRQPQKRATNLPKFRIATFYASDVELWFNQIETQFALHQIDDDDERYSLTCAALSGAIASDVRDVLLQPFRSNKYDSLKAILIERRGLTTPERVNKVISGEKIGSDIPSRFLRRLQKTAGFGTKAVVGKAVIRPLKAAIMAQESCNSPNPWTITLPAVLLGVRSAVKERLGRSAAEMIYGTTLRLPGEFTKQYNVDANTDLENYSDKLRVAMSRLRLCPPRDTQQHNIFQFKEIATCTHVFLRRIAIAPPLTAPYDGPYKVVARSGRVMKILVKGKVETVSLDRVKPAHMECEPTTGTTTQHNRQASRRLPGHLVGIHRVHLDLVVRTLRRPTGRESTQKSRRQAEAIKNRQQSKANRC